jgi:hypothetical protein
MKSNKNIVYVSTENFGAGSADQLRVALNKYWHNLKLAKTSTQFEESQLVATTNLYFGFKSTRSDIGYTYTLGEDLNMYEWPIKRQTIQIFAEDGYTDEEWKEYVLSTVKTGVVFTDLSHQINLPLTLEELAELNDSPYDTVTANPEYNFYLKEYESSKFQSNISENDLPSLYSYASWAEAPDSVAANNVTNNGTFTKHMVRALGSEGTSSRYFKNFIKGSAPSSDRSNTENIYFTTDNVKRMLDYKNTKNSFPMFSEIKFTTDNRAKIADVMRDSNMSSEFIKMLSDDENSISSGIMQRRSFLTGPTDYKTVDAKVYDINTWVQNFLDYGPFRMMPDSYFTGRPNMDVATADTDNAKNTASLFSQQLHGTILLGKLREYGADKFSDLVNLFTGDIKNSETIAYRIAKFKGNPTGIPIQNFWIFNSTEVDVVEFIDTQVKYNNQYSYQVYAYNFVIGTEYKYSKLAISERAADNCIRLVDVNTKKVVNQKIKYKVKDNQVTKTTTLIPVDQNPGYIAEFEMIAKPLYRIVEALVYSRTFKVLDSPPLPPEVRIHPFVGVKDKIKIFFQGSIGSNTFMPIAIEESDRNLFTQLRIARSIKTTDPIPYSTDDYPAIYEIYRSTVKPRSYRDFSGKLKARFDLRNKRKLSSSVVTSGAYDDKIRPNQKYYYTVRCYDSHGNISNPSPIHEIELVEDKGAVYLVHNVIELDKQKPHMVSKPMKRLLYFVPSIAQSVINEEQSKFENLNSAKNLENMIKLGEMDESVWGKQFKMRLVSNKTGRKIDINLNFRVEHIRTEVENE